MRAILDRVRRSIARDGLIPPGATLAAAVSGGSDSIALVTVLADLAATGTFTLTGLAHLNHRLRGADSDRDEAFCRRIADRMGIACEVGHADVRGLAESAHLSIEVAARQARYRFLEEASVRLGANLVATGHTRDDQAETMFLHLLRGAGRSGLAGIPPRRGRFVRPLLDVSREELRALLAERGVDYRDDATNADPGNPRNWIRLELIPLLNARFGGDLAATLARQSRLLRDEDRLLDALASEAMARSVPQLEPEAGRARLDLTAWRLLPPALARRVLRLLMRDIGVRHAPGADTVEAIFDLGNGAAPHGAIDLPGVRVERIGEIVVLHSGGVRRHRPPSRGFDYELPVPGHLDAGAEGFGLEARIEPDVRQVVEEQMVTAASDRAVIDAAFATPVLRVRSRRAGDALVPLGMKGRKKLQDVFVDSKVPREMRDRVPLVVDRNGRIVWVAGVVQSEHAKVTERTQSVVTLRLSRLGDWL